MPSIFDIKINTIDNNPIDWNDFKGKKIIIVNVASECGYTSQYTQLQELYEQYEDKLVVIGVPCNDFGGQEPGTLDEIKTFCSTKYRVTFPMTEKVGIKKDTHPLYQWLTSKSLNGVSDHQVQWNFHKFLINEDGSIYAALKSGVSPLDDQIISWVK
jgi:glutathione peroxidase